MEKDKSNNDDYDIEDDINRIIQGETIYEELDDISSSDFETEMSNNDGNQNELEIGSDDESESDKEEAEMEKEISGGSKLLNSEWNLWYHHSKNDWTIHSYRKFNMKIQTIRDFWGLFNNIDKLGGIRYQHLFLMRDDIEPTWEHRKNRHGGSWSIKVTGSTELDVENRTKELWEKICVSIIGETLSPIPAHINGSSVCLKNFSVKSGLTYVIKIWNDDCKESSLDLLPRYILDNYEYNIIYKANIPEDV